MQESYERQEIAGLKFIGSISEYLLGSCVHICALVPTTFLEIALCQTCMFYIYDADTWLCPIGVRIKESRL